MKYSIFYFEGDMKNHRLREQLIYEAADAYCRSRGIGFDPHTARLEREEGGKPYFAGLPFHFNVSHSENLWIMIAGPAPCGIDIQVVKECRWEDISARYFSEAEQKFTEEMGLTGFFAVWTRREAYGKYTGKGFFGDMPSFVDEEGCLAEEAGGAFIRQIPVAHDILCAYCTGDIEDEIEFFG